MTKVASRTPGRSPTAHDAFARGNLLLETLGAADRALILPHLERAHRARGDVIFRPGEDVSHVTFPVDRTVAAFVVTMRDGRSVETATVGREGAMGGVVSEGWLPAFAQAVVQVGGPVLRLEAERLQRAKAASPAIRDLFVRYSDCLLAQTLQTVACSTVHPIEERCLRWLLTLQDRLGAVELPITHETLAEMLGVRRTYLTGVLGTLQRRGLISVGRGRITVLDRKAVETTACECHGVVRRHFRTVLGAVYGNDGEILSLDAARARVAAAPRRRQG